MSCEKIAETIQKITNAAAAELAKTLTNQTKEVIDMAVKNELVEKINAAVDNNIYVYDWTPIDTSKYKELKDIPSEKLPRIIRADSVKIVVFKTKGITASERALSSMSPNRNSITQVKYLETIIETIKSTSITYTSTLPKYTEITTNVFITLEGNYFTSEYLITDASDKLEKLEKLRECKGPIPKNVYDFIMGKTSEKIEKIFKYPGDIQSKIASWTHRPAAVVGLHLYKAEKLAVSNAETTKIIEKMRGELQEDREAFEQQRKTTEDDFAMREEKLKLQEEILATKEMLFEAQRSDFERCKEDFQTWFKQYTTMIREEHERASKRQRLNPSPSPGSRAPDSPDHLAADHLAADHLAGPSRE